MRLNVLNFFSSSLFFHPSLRSIRIILYTPKKQRIVCFLLEKKSSLPRRQFFFRMLYLSIDNEIVVKISGRGWCNCTIDRKADKRSTCCRAYHFTVSARALCQHTIAASGKLNRILILNTFFLGELELSWLNCTLHRLEREFINELELFLHACTINYTSSHLNF